MLRTISSQLSIKCKGSKHILNLCFDALAKYNGDNGYNYLVLDGHSSKTINWTRIRSNIFPQQNGKIEPIIFVSNPQCQAK